MVDRRRILRMGGTALGLGLAGCLRLSGNSPQSTETGMASNGSPSTETGGTATESPSTSTATGGGSETYSVNEFRLNSFDSDGSLHEVEDYAKLDVETGNGRVELDGTWSGNREIFATQACGLYSFDLLEDGSVVASTGEKILIYGYQYVMAQSADAAFITYQPSVLDDWDRTLRLSYPDGEYTVTPEIRPDDGVFEFDFSSANIEPGRYEWDFEITPPDGFTINIATFNDRLISVSPSGDSFPSRDEAISSAGAAANASATTVEPPQTQQGDGMEIRETGTGGGGPGDIAGEYVTRNAYVDCTSELSFGPGVSRTFRINDLTNDTSLTFTPE